MYISSPRIDIGKKKIQKILIVFVVIRKFCRTSPLTNSSRLMRQSHQSSRTSPLTNRSRLMRQSHQSSRTSPLTNRSRLMRQSHQSSRTSPLTLNHKTSL
jgi:galactokinase